MEKKKEGKESLYATQQMLLIVEHMFHGVSSILPLKPLRWKVNSSAQCTDRNSLLILLAGYKCNLRLFFFSISVHNFLSAIIRVSRFWRNSFLCENKIILNCWGRGWERKDHSLFSLWTFSTWRTTREHEKHASD